MGTRSDRGWVLRSVALLDVDVEPWSDRGSVRGLVDKDVGPTVQEEDLSRQGPSSPLQRPVPKRPVLPGTSRGTTRSEVWGSDESPLGEDPTYVLVPEVSRSDLGGGEICSKCRTTCRRVPRLVFVKKPKGQKGPPSTGWSNPVYLP